MTFLSSTTLSSATVTIVGGNAHDELSVASTLSGGITSSFSGATLTLTGTANLDSYHTALRMVSFETQGEMVDKTAKRTISATFTVCHTSTVCSASATVTIEVHPVNDLPTVSFATDTFAYTQDGAAVQIAAGMEFSDVDSTQLQGAAVQLMGNQCEGDVLAISPGTANIALSYNEATGALELAGTATVAQYQQAIRTLTFLPSNVCSSDRFIAIGLTDSTGSSSWSNQITVSICANLGSYNDLATSTLKSCPQGKFNDHRDTCATSCTSCDTGRFGGDVSTMPVTSDAHCAQCATGKYQDQAGQAECTECAAGTFGNFHTSPSSIAHCQACEVGKYNDVVGQTSCEACAAGHYADTQGSTACAMCSGCQKGEYYTGCTTGTSDSFCAVCAVGKFSVCPAGTDGLCHKAQCTSCLAGTFGDAAVERDSALHCTSCATGTFQGSTAATECSVCAAGTFAEQLGMTACESCVAGQYQASTAADACVACTAGKFGTPSAPQTDAAYCSHCPDGKYQTESGVHGVCTSCAAGKYAIVDEVVNDSEAHCAACGPGRYQDTVEFVEQCKQCPSLQFQAGFGALQCETCSDTTCSAGHFVSETCNPMGRTADRVCSPAPALSGVSGTIQFTETDVEAGSAGYDSMLCPAAAIAFAATLSSATITINGGNANDELTFSSSATIAGTFNPETRTLTLNGVHGASASVFQAALQSVRFRTAGEMLGVHTQRAITATIKVCHTPTEAAAAALVGAAGVCSNEQTVAININPVNDVPTVSGIASIATYTHGSPVPIASSAVVADPDHTTIERAVATIIDLQAGDVLSADVSAIAGVTATWTAAAGALEIAGTGTIAEYQQAIHAIHFHSTSGSLSTAPRSISIVIRDGLNATSTNDPLVSVEVCAAAGFYANADTQLITACASGSFQTATCATTCTSCAVGTFGDDKAAARSAAGHCVACSAGKYQTEVGQTSCLNCAAGKFGVAATPETVSSCQACAFGKSQSAEGQSSCTYCAVGRFAASTEASTCDACVPGRYANAVGRAQCTACEAGKASAAEGQASDATCTTCMDGSYAPAEGLTSCLPWATCPAGTSNSGASPLAAGSCEACASGTFQSSSTSVAEPCAGWTSCAAGQYITGQSATLAGTCQTCAVGEYSTAAIAQSFAGCTKCAAGKASGYNGATSEGSCTSCAAGQFAAAAGAGACIGCADGTFGAVGATTCTACAAASWQAWGTCSKSCEGGTRTRSRTITSTGPAAAAQCSTTQTGDCNLQACPHRVHCKHLKCRFKKVPNTADDYAVQVYHHHKDAPAVHHCKLYTQADGSTECHCHCWQTTPTMLSETVPSWTSQAIRGGHN